MDHPGNAAGPARTARFAALFRALRAVLRTSFGVVLLTYGMAGRADVVPPEAVDIATRWLTLVDAGRFREAAACCFDARDADAARAAITALERRGARSSAAQVTGRTVASWSGHGVGDSSRMAAGGYFRLTFETATADGRTTVEEVRLVPYRDGDWRVVGYTPSAGGA